MCHERKSAKVTLGRDMRIKWAIPKLLRTKPPWWRTKIAVIPLG